MAEDIGQALLRDAIGGERDRFVQLRAGGARIQFDRDLGCGSRQPCASASNAPARPISSSAAGRSRPRMRRLTCCNAASLFVDAPTIRRERGRVRRLAGQRPDAGADGEQKGADLVMEVAGDVAPLLVLHVDHAPREPAVLVVEPFAASRPAR